MTSVTVFVFLFIVGSLGLAVFDVVVPWAFGCFLLFFADESASGPVALAFLTLRRYHDCR